MLRVQDAQGNLLGYGFTPDFGAKLEAVGLSVGTVSEGLCPNCEGVGCKICLYTGEFPHSGAFCLDCD
jgi:hypothetical protein